MIDFAHVPTRQDAIHLRLEQWARWVRVTPKGWATHPMWRNAKTPRQWDIDPHIHQTMNTLEAHEIERAVSLLPSKHRSAVRWFYVFPFIHQGKIQRELAVTNAALAQLVVDGRDMLTNRLRTILKETA